MWLWNKSDTALNYGGICVGGQTQLETLDLPALDKFLANGVVKSFVAKGALLVLEEEPTQPPYTRHVYYNGTELPVYGVCYTCGGLTDAATGRHLTDENSLATPRTLYLSEDGQPANVYYREPNELVIERRM